MALSKEEKQQKEQERLARVAEAKAELAEKEAHKAYIDELRVKASEEKIKADINRYTFEKMDFFIKAHGVAERYYQLLDEQQQKRAEMAKLEQEMKEKLQSLNDNISTGTVDEWIKANSPNGEQSLEEVLKNTEESVS